MVSYLVSQTRQDISCPDRKADCKSSWPDRRSHHELARSLEHPAGALRVLEGCGPAASAGFRPCVKQVDTLAAEFPAKTSAQQVFSNNFLAFSSNPGRNYLYLTYVGNQNDVPPLKSENLAPHKAQLEGA